MNRMVTDSVKVSSGTMQYYQPMWLKFWLKTTDWKKILDREHGVHAQRMEVIA